MTAAVLGVVAVLFAAVSAERLAGEWIELQRTFKGMNDAA